MPEFREAFCSSCQAPIYWAESTKGGKIAVDRVKTSIVLPIGDKVTGHRPHYATWKNADEHQRRP